jgi:hypothetical protein
MYGGNRNDVRPMTDEAARRKRPSAQSTIDSNRLVSSLSVVAINNALVSVRWPPTHNLIAIDRDLGVNSRGVSVVVTQEPTQPRA